MNTALFALVLSLLSASFTEVLAATRTISSLAPAEAKLNVHQVADSILLGRNEQKDISVRLISEFLGQPTDVSPRKNLYITFFHGREMCNTSTAFALESVWSFLGTKRISAGIYEVSFEDLNLKPKKIVVDTTQVFIDEAKLDCENLQDSYFFSTINVKE